MVKLCPKCGKKMQECVILSSDDKDYKSWVCIYCDVHRDTDQISNTYCYGSKKTN